MLCPTHEIPDTLVLCVAAEAAAQCSQNLPATSSAVTHYPSAGGTQTPPFGPDPGWPYKTYGSSAPVPYLDNYLFETYAQVAGASAANINSLLQQYCTDSGNVPFAFYNYSPGIIAQLQAEPPVAGWSGPGTGRVRIVHGVEIPGADSFVSLILPQTFNALANQPDRHPLVVEGYYDVNDNFFGGLSLPQPSPKGHGDAYYIARIIAESGKFGRAGAIGVIWNGGSSSSSITGTALDRAHFTAIMDYMRWQVSGNPFKTYMVGRSRGASAALLMASNPAPHSGSYRIKFIAAIAPGVLFGEHAELIGAALPPQFNALSAATGYWDSWLPGWVYPPGSFLSGYSARDVTRYNFFGATSQADADLNHSLDSTSFLNALQAENPEIVLSIGSHDPFIPFGHQVEYMYKLRARGIHVKTRVFLGGGHLHDNVYDTTMGANGLAGAVLAEVDGLPFSVDHSTSDSIEFYRATSNSADRIWTLNAASPFPFTVQMPKRLYSGLPAHVLVTGPPNTQFDIRTVGGTPVWGQIPASRNFTYITLPTIGWGAAKYDVTSVWVSHWPYTNPFPLDHTKVVGWHCSGLTTMFVEVLGAPPYIHAGTAASNLANSGCGVWPELAWGLYEHQ